MSVRATILRVDGTTSTEIFDHGPPLAYLQQQVEGFIEIVPGLPHRVIVNEDARRIGLPVNQLAAERFGDVAGSVDGYLRGVVVVIEPVQ